MPDVKEKEKEIKTERKGQELLRYVESRSVNLEEDRFPSNIRIGDTIRVYYYLDETKKKRMVFEGMLIARKGGGIKSSFTVRRIVQGVGVEKTFRLYSPLLDRIEFVKRPYKKPRRAKLFYVRKKK